MKTKEEVIKEAWGDLYNLGVGIDENGWVSENYLTNDQCNLFNYDKSFDYKNVFGYRPKSLQGIENNNGWIKIESEKDLPKEYDSEKYKMYYFTSNGFYEKNDYLLWIGYYGYMKITHYRLEPIFKPQPPLY